MVAQKAFQDYITEDQFNHCWGCGRKNNHGFRIKSYWEGDEAICRFHPEEFHMAAHGILNGGVIATIIDCHSTLTAIATVYRAAGRELGSKPIIAYVTASLEINYLRPTPIEPIILRAKAQESDGKRITVNCSLYANGQECVRAVVVAARVPADFIKHATKE
ncbi:MAG: PaaI family thioesterase [Candidatus Heimdallarchaeota archaeon]